MSSINSIFKKLYFILVKIIFDLIYGKLNPIQDNIFKNIKIIKIKIVEKSNKEYEIYEIEKARVYSDLSQNVAYIKDGQVYDKLSIQIEDNTLVNVNKNKILKTGTRKFLQKKIDGNVLSLIQGVPGIENYGHWLLDIIPKLIITKRYKNLNSFDAFLFPNINKEFQKTTFDYFDIPKEKLIDGSKIRHLYADKFTIPAHPYWELDHHQLTTVSNVDKNILLKIQDIFLSKNKNNEKNSKKIFIDRSDSKFNHNKLSNNDEVCIHLKELGFEIVQLTKLSFEEQIKIFNSAQIVVANHGAGLTNIIFCKTNTQIVEIESPNFKCDVFGNISNYLNLNYKKVKANLNTSNNEEIFVELKNLNF